MFVSPHPRTGRRCLVSVQTLRSFRISSAAFPSSWNNVQPRSFTLWSHNIENTNKSFIRADFRLPQILAVRGQIFLRHRFPTEKEKLIPGRLLSATVDATTTQERLPRAARNSSTHMVPHRTPLTFRRFVLARRRKKDSIYRRTNPPPGNSPRGDRSRSAGSSVFQFHISKVL